MNPLRTNKQISSLNKTSDLNFKPKTPNATETDDPLHVYVTLLDYYMRSYITRDKFIAFSGMKPHSSTTASG